MRWLLSEGAGGHGKEGGPDRCRSCYQYPGVLYWVQISSGLRSDLIDFDIHVSIWTNGFPLLRATLHGRNVAADSEGGVL